MAFPSIAEAVAFSGKTTNTGSTLTVSHAASGIEDGDLLILLMSNDGGSPTVPAGWTGSAAAGAGMGGLAAWQEADGTEDGTTFDVTLSGSEKAAAVILRIPADEWDSVEISTTAGSGGNADIDPGSFTPSGGSAEILWIAWGGHDNGTRTITDSAGYPANYTSGTFGTDYGHVNEVGLEPGNAGTSAGCGVAWASRELEASSEDPGAFDLSTNDGVVAGVIAVYPSAAAPAVTGTVAETLADTTVVASGTHTPPAITGTLSETLVDTSIAASGTNTPPGNTGTLAETLDDTTSAGSGTVVAPGITGTLAETLGDTTASAAGELDTYADDFNRANENPLRGDWIDTQTWGDVQLIGNEVSGAVNAAVQATMLDPSVFQPPADQYAEVEIAALQAGFNCGVILRWNETDEDGYGFVIGNSDTNAGVYRIDAGVNTRILDLSGEAASVGEVWRVTIVGSTIEVSRDGTVVGSVTDATYSAAGRVGIQSSHTGALADNFQTGPGILSGNVSGSLSETLDDTTSSASGSLIFEGTLAETLDDTTSSASGALGISGTVSETLEDTALSASGSPGYNGSLAETLDDTTLAASGGSGLNASLAETLDDTTLSASGTNTPPDITGTVAQTLDDTTSAAAGGLTITGSLAETLDDTTLAASGGPVISGSLAETLDDTTVAAAGWVRSVSFSASPTTGAELVITLSGGNWPSTGKTLTVEGNTIVPDSQDATTMTFDSFPELPELANFMRYGVAYNFSVNDGVGGSVISSQTVVKASGADFFAITGAPTYTSPSIYSGSSGLANGDEHYGYPEVGTLTSISTDGVVVASSSILVYKYWIAHIDTTDWLGPAIATVGTYGGVLAETLDDTTVAAAGAVGAPAVTGSLAETLDDTTSSASGEIQFIGSLAETLDDTTASAAGSLGFVGSLAETLDDTTASAAGEQEFSGSLAETLDDTTLAASGTNTPEGVAGSLAESLDDTTLAASGTNTPPAVTGSVAESLEDTTSAATGTNTPPLVTGTVAESLEDTTSAATGTNTPPGVTGSLAETLEDTTSSALGAVGDVTFGIVDATLEDTTASALGEQIFTGTVSVTTADATSSIEAEVQYSGVVDALLEGVQLAADGELVFEATLAETLDDATASINGTVVSPVIAGSLAETLDDVVSSISGLVAAPITGTVGATLEGTVSTSSGTVGALLVIYTNKVTVTFTPGTLLINSKNEITEAVDLDKNSTNEITIDG